MRDLIKAAAELLALAAADEQTTDQQLADLFNLICRLVSSQPGPVPRTPKRPANPQ